MKVVINTCFGGFGLSTECIIEYLKLKGKECYFYNHDYKTKTYVKTAGDNLSWNYIILTKDIGDVIEAKELTDNWKNYIEYSFYDRDIKRNDKDLLKAIKKIGIKNSGGNLSQLKIVDVSGDRYEIDSYDGNERIKYLC